MKLIFIKIFLLKNEEDELQSIPTLENLKDCVFGIIISLLFIIIISKQKQILLFYNLIPTILLDQLSFLCSSSKVLIFSSEFSTIFLTVSVNKL